MRPRPLCRREAAPLAVAQSCHCPPMMPCPGAPLTHACMHARTLKTTGRLLDLGSQVLPITAAGLPRIDLILLGAWKNGGKGWDEGAEGSAGPHARDGVRAGHPDDCLGSGRGADRCGVSPQHLSSGQPRSAPVLQPLPPRRAGVGPDGHVASVFPNTPEAQASTDWVQPIHNSPKPPPERITLSLSAINAAANIAVVSLGEVGSGRAWTLLAGVPGCRGRRGKGQCNGRFHHVAYRHTLAGQGRGGAARAGGAEPAGVAAGAARPARAG